jgi:hypothetical protein
MRGEIKEQYEVTITKKFVGEWRNMHNGELHNLYSSLNIIRQIKSRRMRWLGHVAHKGAGRKMNEVLV